MEKTIMKKLAKLITFVLVIALCLFTPGTPVALKGISQLVVAADSNTTTSPYTAPAQIGQAFERANIDVDDISSWNKQPGTNDYLVYQQVTTENNGSFHDKYPDRTLADIGSLRTPSIIVTKKQNTKASGYYTTPSAITLPANGYFKINVEYCVKNQTGSSTEAFGTFYLKLNDHETRAIDLRSTSWDNATYYLQTDALETAEITPELYFGAREEATLGAIYFNNFTITALNKTNFENAVYDNSHQLINPNTYYNFSKLGQDYVNVSGDFSNAKFLEEDAINSEEISVAGVPSRLGFDGTIYSKDGNDNTNKVLLMHANNNNATMKLNGYTLLTNPHEIYMFQFYSIAMSSDTFNNFYFTITANAENENGEHNKDNQSISILKNYPYHNGWQLNTVFYVAGRGLDQEFTLGFNLSQNATDKTTGWVCIDDFKIYKVSSNYAQANKEANDRGVQNYIDKNKKNTANDEGNTESTDAFNGYFNSGISADTVTINDSGYPYPLIADSWTSNSKGKATNGIVNLGRWDASFGDGENRPYAISNLPLGDNNVYMIHKVDANNDEAAANVVTSPALTVTTGATTYIAFDIFSQDPTVAQIITATAADDDNAIVLSEINIRTNNNWKHYEFQITESSYAASRSYYLRFKKYNTGFAYIDNVEVNDTADTTSNKTSIEVDLTNYLTNEQIWQSSDESVTPQVLATTDGLFIKNQNGHKTIVVENSLAYNLTSDQYYEIVVSSRGYNAHLGLKGYDGLLAVTTNEVDPTLTETYKLYVQIKDTTTTNIQITLDYDAEDNTHPYGEILIDKLEINQIGDAEYNSIKENLNNKNNTHMMILSPTDESSTETSVAKPTDNGNPFGENWWYLIPTLITALALLLAIITFLFRKIKFDKHITKKNTSYARDMRLKNQQKKIVAQKATKVDNVTDEQKNN